LFVCDDGIFKIKMTLRDVLLHNSPTIYKVNETAKFNRNCRDVVNLSKIPSYQTLSISDTYLGTPVNSFKARSSCQLAISAPLVAFVCLLYAVSVILLKLFKF
jgi:hypothetical protein